MGKQRGINKKNKNKKKKKEQHQKTKAKKNNEAGSSTDEEEFLDKMAQQTEKEKQQDTTKTKQDAKKEKKQKKKKLSKEDEEADKQAQQQALSLTQTKKTWSLDSDMNLTSLKGLQNLGNTCFFNSVMQSLSHTKPLVAHFIDFNDVFKVTSTAPKELSFCGPMTCALSVFYSQMFQTSTHPLVDPSLLFRQIVKNAPRFRGYQQQDSHELLTFLRNIAIDEYDKAQRTAQLKEQAIAASASTDSDANPPDTSTDSTSTSCVDTPKKSESKTTASSPSSTPKNMAPPESLLKMKNIMDKAFKGILCSTVMCHHCGNISRTFEESHDVSLPIPKRPPPESKVKLSKLFDDLRISETKYYERNKKEILDPANINAYSSTIINEDDEISLAHCLLGFTRNELLSTKDDNGYICEKCSSLTSDKSNSEPVIKPQDTTDDQPSPLTPFATDNLPSVTQPKPSLVESSDDDDDDDDDKKSKKESKPDQDFSTTTKKPKQTPRDASRQYSFFNPPEILALHLKRFIRPEELRSASKKKRYSLLDTIGGYIKNQEFVHFPLKLDLSPFVHPSSPYASKDNLYALYALVEHMGSINSGHYVSFVRKLKLSATNGQSVTNSSNVDTQRGNWVYVSDHHFKEVQPKEVKKADAYILFYERIHKD